MKQPFIKIYYPYCNADEYENPMTSGECLYYSLLKSVYKKYKKMFTYYPTQVFGMSKKIQYICRDGLIAKGYLKQDGTIKKNKDTCETYVTFKYKNFPLNKLPNHNKQGHLLMHLVTLHLLEKNGYVTLADLSTRLGCTKRRVASALESKNNLVKCQYLQSYIYVNKQQIANANFRDCTKQEVLKHEGKRIDTINNLTGINKKTIIKILILAKIIQC